MVFECPLGASYLGERRCRFVVWAPLVEVVEVHLVWPEERLVPMQRGDRGYYHAVVEGVAPGARYYYRLNGAKDRPDPASRFQPEGVHGPSQVVDLHSFPWEDRCWFGLPLSEYVVYELHVGTFTPEGTFDAIVPRLDELRDLGVTAVELMPVAQFPGSRNWGYDGTYPFAVQSSYGGPAGLQRLVDACHRRGIAVVLDVVYNHLGPEGNYLAEYAPYFTDRYRTPWGAGINFDGPHSDEVRRYFVENALHWLTTYHVDALRLDAVHAIRDFSASPFLAELAAAVRRRAEQINRRLHLIAESDLNDARLVLPPAIGGYGLDGQWSDDFHHALHALVTGEREGYYQDYGEVAHLAKALREGYVYTGQRSSYRGRRHGNSPRLVQAHQLVVCAQNHDQVGNRKLGERLSQLVPFEKLKLAAGALLVAPYVPLLFMGEEYGETAPFQYFVSHSDPELIEAVRRGRREEFAAFQWQGDVPDPQDEATFLRSKLRHELRHQGNHRVLQEWYRALLRLRKELPSLRHLSKEHLDVTSQEEPGAVFVRRWTDEHEALAVLHFGDRPATVAPPVPLGRWDKALDSAEERWLGPGSSLPALLDAEERVTLEVQPWSFALYTRRTTSLP